MNSTIVLVKDDEKGTENPWKTQHFSLLLLAAAAKVSICITYLQAGEEEGGGKEGLPCKMDEGLIVPFRGYKLTVWNL